MLKQLIVLLAFMFCIKTAAQSSYNAFKLDNVEWQLNSINGQPPTSQTNYYYKLCGDTIVKDTVYKKMYYANYNYPYPAWPGYVFPTPAFSLYGFFRQDSIAKTDYFRALTDSVSGLWYCYNYNIGDTLKQYNMRMTCSGTHFTQNVCSSGQPKPFIILKTDSITISGKKFKIYLTDTSTTNCIISTVYYPKPGMYLMEGLGHCFGIFDDYFPPFEGNITLSAIYFDTVCTNLNLAAIQTISSSKNMRVYPTPATNTITIEATNYDNNSPVWIEDLLGNTLIKCTLQQKNINVANLSNGVYMLHVGNTTTKIIIQQ